MNDAGPETTLRPLGLGELLDRAVTLCVKHVAVLASIFVLYAVPLGIIQFYAARDYGHLMQAITAALTPHAGTADPAALRRALATLPPLGAWYPLLIAVGLFVGPLVAGALTFACARAYLGEPIDAVAAYRRAVSRWLPLVAVNLLYITALVVGYVLVGLVAIVAIFAVVAVTAALKGVGIAAGALVGVVFVLASLAAVVVGIASLAVMIVGVLAYQVSYFACVVENVSAVAAFALGVRRVFARARFVRSLLVGTAFAAVWCGILFVSFAGEAVLVGLVHSTVAGAVYETILRVATAAFSTAFVAIFYFDLRVRDEGLDLQMAADRIGARALPTA